MIPSRLFPDQRATAARHGALIRGSFRERYLPFAVAAILLGGASVNKASMLNVIVGTFLFQGILTMTPSVINSLIQTDMSEVIRIIVSNGMILYALTRKVQVKR